jgi:site-specific DNA-methyltransferase (adenine-specific)/modification methylase
METIKLNEIKGFFQVRKYNETFITFLVNDFKENGFNSAYPVSITDNWILWDGNHRYEAAKRAGITEIPCIIESPDNIRFEAHERNRVGGNSLPETFVDHAEEIWALLADGKTQKEVADELNWSLSKIKQYARLENIAHTAWNKVTESFTGVTLDTEGDVTKKVTNVTFTEGLLREIIDLTPEQQTELVFDLASEKINKGRFKQLAENYRTRNKLIKQFEEQTAFVDDSELKADAIAEIESGRYDKLGIDTLIKATIDAYQKKNSIRLIHGNFYEEVKNIPDKSVDLILTDPPYNVANDREFVFEGRKNISKDFGEWDRHEHNEFKAMLDVWAFHFNRILTDNGSGYIFTSDVYISHLRESLEKAGLRYRATITWHKTNPGTSVTKSNFISSTEYIIYFSKDHPVFNFTDDNDMHNFIESPLCGGNERLKDAKGDTLHPTQKPKSIIRKLMDISSNRGQTVFDGFMGVGTTAKVAKNTGRKFIGIEQDENFYRRCGE